MALLTLGIASATLAGSLAAQWTPMVLILCVVAALNYGVLASLDPTASWIGQQCAVYVVVSSYFANGVHYAVGRTAMVLIGGLLQMILFTGFRYLHRYSNPGDTEPPPLRRQIRTRVGQLWRATRERLNSNAGMDGYVLKLVITLGLSTMLYRYLHWRNGYRAPMTALLVLRPKWANTLSRGIARLTGTLVGAAITVLLAYLLPPFHHWVYFGLVLITAYACFAVQAVNYAFFSVVLTLNTVFLFAFGGFSERSAASLRLINTALGGFLALLVDYIAHHVASRAAPGRRRKTPRSKRGPEPAGKLRTISPS